MPHRPQFLRGARFFVYIHFVISPFCFISTFVFGLELFFEMRNLGSGFLTSIFWNTEVGTLQPYCVACLLVTEREPSLCFTDFPIVSANSTFPLLSKKQREHRERL